MHTLLSLYCILGLSIIIYGIIQGLILLNFIHDCNTIYIPDDLMLILFLKTVLDMDINALKKS